MNRNRYIINQCSNFHKIINYDYEKEDTLTTKIINIYRSYIFDINIQNKNELKKVKELDKIVYKYLEDYNLRQEIKKRFSLIDFVTTKDIVESFVNQLLIIYKNYLDETTRKIYIAKWI